MTAFLLTLPVYIISIDPLLAKRTKDQLKQAGFPSPSNIYVWKGVDGYDQKTLQDHRLHPFGAKLCSPKMRGCGLSHLHLLHHLYHHHPWSDHPYVLILEEDIRVHPSRQKHTYSQILSVLSYHYYSHHRSHPPRWNLWLLFCQGDCQGGTWIKKWGRGSTAAYIVTKDAAKCFEKVSLLYHIDIQRHFLLPSLVLEYDFLQEPFFLTFDPTVRSKSWSWGGQTFKFWLHQHLYVWGCSTWTVRHLMFWTLSFFVTSIMILGIYVYSKYSKYSKYYNDDSFHFFLFSLVFILQYVSFLPWARWLAILWIIFSKKIKEKDECSHHHHPYRPDDLSLSVVIIMIWILSFLFLWSFLILLIRKRKCFMTFLFPLFFLSLFFQWLAFVVGFQKYFCCQDDLTLLDP